MVCVSTHREESVVRPENHHEENATAGDCPALQPGKRTLGDLYNGDYAFPESPSQSCKRARLPCETWQLKNYRWMIDPTQDVDEVRPKTLEDLLAVATSGTFDPKTTGPPDMGGRIAEMLWGYRVEFSSAMEYMMLQLGMSRDERERLPGARRVSTPELWNFARCSRSVRKGIVLAAAARRRTIEPDASAEQRQKCIEIVDVLRSRFPSSWSHVRGPLRDSLVKEAAECQLPPITVDA
eukprot:TRINITY_DN12031_c0_g1_i2.p1 TRINITY_DN12031_c0_g1~~TRINITY_DN12031_c0_g1_i2.p1  ORF type:complete len:238 (+),score=39.54 TRINITY_DN12031_c0_g1_i2:160-873(+)